MTRTADTAIYTRCQESDTIAVERWDVPRRHQGQIVEVAFGRPGHHRDESDDGDEFKRVTDRSVPSVSYYRLAN